MLTRATPLILTGMTSPEELALASEGVDDTVDAAVFFVDAATFFSEGADDSFIKSAYGSCVFARAY